MTSKLVKDIMTPASKLIFLSSTDTVEQAYQTMRKNRIHSVIVQRSYGSYDLRIFTYAELREAWASGEDPSKASLERFAAVIEAVAEPDWTCNQCRAQMRGADHLIVADRFGNLLGLVSITDIDEHC